MPQPQVIDHLDAAVDAVLARVAGDIVLGEGEALACLQPPQGLIGLSSHLLHPGLLDACIQTTGATQLAATPRQTTLPFMLSELI